MITNNNKKCEPFNWQITVTKICKARSGLPISVNWTFLLGVVAEELWVKIDWKSAFWKGVGQYTPNFHLQGHGDVPHQSFPHK